MIPDFSIYRLKSFLEALPMVVTCRRRVLIFCKVTLSVFFPNTVQFQVLSFWCKTIFSVEWLKSALGKNHWFECLYTIVSFLPQITSSLLGILTIVLRFLYIKQTSWAFQLRSPGWLIWIFLRDSTPVNSSGRIYLSLYKRLHPEI